MSLSPVVFERIENELIEALSPLKEKGFEVLPLPENEKDYNRPQDKPRVTVCYSKSKYEPTKGTNQVSQEESLFYTIIIESKTRRGDSGVYTVLNLVRAILLGFKPTDSGRLTLVEQELNGISEGYWTYSAVFSTKALIMQVDPGDLGPPLKSTTFD